MSLTLRLLGPPEIELDGQPATGFVSDKARALLFYLVVETDRAFRRETLAGLLWPGYPEGTALRFRSFQLWASGAPNGSPS